MSLQCTALYWIALHCTALQSPFLIGNIEQGWKKLPETNTLAYMSRVSAMKSKGFEAFAPMANGIMLFSFISQVRWSSGVKHTQCRGRPVRTDRHRSRKGCRIFLRGKEGYPGINSKKIFFLHHWDQKAGAFVLSMPFQLGIILACQASGLYYKNKHEWHLTEVMLQVVASFWWLQRCHLWSYSASVTHDDNYLQLSYFYSTGHKSLTWKGAPKRLKTNRPKKLEHLSLASFCSLV